MWFNDVVLRTAAGWLEEGRPVAIATITRIQGSSSQPLGSRMAITDNEEFIGSVSGGCVERDVYTNAQEAIAEGGQRLLGYSKVEEGSLEVGLNCEGRIDVLVEPVDQELLSQLRRPVGQTLVTRYDPAQRNSADFAASRRVETSATSEEEATSRLLQSEGIVEFREPNPAAPTLLILGATPVAAPLARLAKVLGFYVAVTDPRAAYAQPAFFPDADTVIAAWPRELPGHLDSPEFEGSPFGHRCYVVSLNHEPRFEDDAFRMLMDQPRVAYIGSMGKRRRQEEREARQGSSGFDLSKLPPIHTPIGLDLGGKRPEEVALAILAEIQAARSGKSGGMLSGGTGVDRVGAVYSELPIG